MNIFVVIICVIFSNVVPFGLSLYSNKTFEGYSNGYLSDCPKASHEPIILKKTLYYLSFYVHEDGDKRGRYNYYQMKQLASKMDFNRTTMVYVGGYLDIPWFVVAGSIGSTYKKIGYNVLLVDNNYFTTMQYPLAALYSRTVGKRVADMLFDLSKHGLNPKKLELVGLSLGGQTISFIAKHFHKLSGIKVSRVTGLDPAGPCFRNLGPDDRLHKTDADFVDTINTNIEGFGTASPLGHVNFYVNGGENQPGDFQWMPCDVLCSHIRSLTLWISALQNTDSFIAMQCSSVQEARLNNCYDKTPQVTNIVGPKTDRSKRGIFYLATDQNYPYFLGEKGLKRENEYFWNLMKRIVDSDSLVI